MFVCVCATTAHSSARWWNLLFFFFFFFFVFFAAAAAQRFGGTEHGRGRAKMRKKKELKTLIKIEAFAQNSRIFWKKTSIIKESSKYM